MPHPYPSPYESKLTYDREIYIPVAVSTVLNGVGKWSQFQCLLVDNRESLGQFMEESPVNKMPLAYYFGRKQEGGSSGIERISGVELGVRDLPQMER